MKTVSLKAAKNQLSRLVEEAANGEEIIIVKAGKPVARLTKLAGGVRGKSFGSMKGRIWMSKDFNDPLPPEILKSFGVE
jgi:prevent-host-death family protein